MPPSNILSQLRLAGIRVPQSSTSMRHFSPQCTSRYPRKDSQDKDSINTEATEYSKSGTDDQSAANEDAAFNSEITRPEKEKEVAGKGNEVSFWCFFSRVVRGEGRGERGDRS